MSRFAFTGVERIGSPCLNCERRQVGCHSTCEDYLQYKAAVAEAKEKINQQKNREAIIREFDITSAKKQIRKKGTEKK